MRALRALLLAVLTVGALAATAYGAGIAVRHYDAGSQTRAAECPSPNRACSPIGGYSESIDNRSYASAAPLG